MSTLDEIPFTEVTNPLPLPPNFRKPASTETALRGRILMETDKAILLEVVGNVGDHWFPLSQVSFIRRALGCNLVNKEFTDIIYVSSWIVNKKGLKVIA